MIDKSRGTIVRDKKYERFVQWLNDNQFPQTKLTLANFTNTGRGMMATEDIAAGEVIISVPRRFLITHDSLGKIYGAADSLSSHELLALHLVLLRKDTQSWWKPYIDLLPLHFNTMPVKYAKVLIDHLPESLKQDTLQQKQNMHQDYLSCTQFLKSLPEPLASQPIDPEEFEWAWLCVNTRCIHMNTPGHTVPKGGHIALAPMLDFLNHTTEAKIESGYNTRTQCFEIKTLTPYKKGEQVYINYGPHDNLAILKEYGFVLSQNTYNFVSLDQEVWQLFSEIETEKGFEIKKQILEGAGYAGDYSIKLDEVSFRLLAALRLLALPGTTQPGFDRKVMDWHDVVMGQTDIISPDNERKAWIMLQTICQKAADKATQENDILNHFTQRYPEAEYHPFALYFLRQIWKESNEIIQNTLESVKEKLVQDK